MQRFKFIFVFVFLAGMLFTVFQYIPILEEDTSSPTSELSKKTTEDENSSDDTNEADQDSDDVINTHLNFNFSIPYSKTHLYSIKKENYTFFFKKINTPPPKA